MLSQELLKEALGKALSTGADYAEISYCESACLETSIL